MYFVDEDFHKLFLPFCADSSCDKPCHKIIDFSFCISTRVLLFVKERNVFRQKMNAEYDRFKRHFYMKIYGWQCWPFFQVHIWILCVASQLLKVHSRKYIAWKCNVRYRDESVSELQEAFSCKSPSTSLSLIAHLDGSSILISTRKWYVFRLINVILLQ